MCFIFKYKLNPYNKILYITIMDIYCEDQFPHLINTNYVNQHQYVMDEIGKFYFLSNRTSLDILQEKYIELFRFIYKKMIVQKCEFLYYLICLYKLIGYFRDIKYGHGERDISYMMICVWYNYYPKMALYVFRLFVNNVNDQEPLGCWSDVKYFCEFVNNSDILITSQKNEIIHYAISIMLYQFDKDNYFWNDILSEYLRKRFGEHIDTIRPDARNYISNVAKWIPREKSKYGWLYDKIVKQWNIIHKPFLFENINTIDQYEKVMKFCKMNFRTMISKINKEIDTPQIKQCNQNWNNIEPQKVTLLTMLKQKSGFTKKRHHTNFTSDFFLNHFHIGESMINENKFKKTNISIGTYVKQAVDLLKYKLTDNTLCKIEFLNHCWTKNVLNHFKNNETFSNFLPIVDISSSLDYKTKYNAIGMGILICQLSKLKRLILIENNFICLNIHIEKDFTDVIREIMPYFQHSVLLNINRFIDYIFNGGAGELIKQSCSFVFLSNSENILKNNDIFFEKYNKNIYWIFWNMGGDIDETFFDYQLNNESLYISGSSPTLFYYLNKNGRYPKKMSTYLFIGELLNITRYSNLSLYLCKQLSN